MLPRNHPDRIQITFDDRRLVANAGSIGGIFGSGKRLPYMYPYVYKEEEDATAPSDGIPWGLIVSAPRSGYLLLPLLLYARCLLER